jgi:hypothetical protein
LLLVIEARPSRSLVGAALGLPFVTASIVLGLLLGPGKKQPVLGARVYSAEEAPRSLRVETVERSGSIERPIAMALRFEGNGESIALQTSERGTGELILSAPLSAGLPVKLHSESQLLLDSPFSAGEAQSAEVAMPWSFGQTGLRVHVRVENGDLAPPFPSVLKLATTRDGQPVDAEVEVTFASAEPETSRVSTGATGLARLPFTPIAAPVQLSVEANYRGERARKSGTLLTKLAAIHARDLGDAVELTSPSPREVAYFSVVGPGGREHGGEVDLNPTEDGFFRARIEKPGGRLLLTSPTAAEDPARTAVWSFGATAPFCDPEATLKSQLCEPIPELLTLRLDSLPANEAREDRRVAAIRGKTLTFLSLALAVEIALVLLLARGRRATAPQVSEDNLNPDYAIKRSHPLAEPAFVVVLILVGVMFALWGWVLRS